MFYCGVCASKNNWPTSFRKSMGLCEVCHTFDACSDVPSKYLPAPAKMEPKPEYVGKHRLDKSDNT